MKYQTTAGFTLVEIMIVVAIIGVLAAIGVPSYRNAIANAQQKACALNRKVIDAAKLQWAVEHQSPPAATPRDDDLFGPDSYIEHKPECPVSGTYSINSVREKCACNIPRHGN